MRVNIGGKQVMNFEEKRNYESPVITIKKFDMQDVISDSYDIEDGSSWIPGWH